MDSEDSGNLEKTTGKSPFKTPSEIIGKRPKNGFLKKKKYDWASKAIEKLQAGVENKYSRHLLLGTIALYGSPLIPSYQTEILDALGESDKSMLSKHGTTSNYLLEGSLMHGGIFTGASFIPGNIDNNLAYLNLMVGLTTNFWRIYMAFKDELEGNKYLGKYAKNIRVKAHEWAEKRLATQGKSQKSADGLVGLLQKPIRSPAKALYKAVEYTFQEGSAPTFAFNWKFLTNNALHKGFKEASK